jgi:hypothetical protein
VNLYSLFVYIKHKKDGSPKDIYHIMVANKTKQIINSTSQKKLQKRRLHVMKGLNKHLATEIAIITQFDKDKTIVEFRLDPHSGRPLTQNNYTRSCINTIVLVRISTGLFETYRGFK